MVDGEDATTIISLFGRILYFPFKGEGKTYKDNKNLEKNG